MATVAGRMSDMSPIPRSLFKTIRTTVSKGTDTAPMNVVKNRTVNITAIRMIISPIVEIFPKFVGQASMNGKKGFGKRFCIRLLRR
jgi:hypothetical protein